MVNLCPELGLEVGEWYSSKQIKEKLQIIYKNKGIDKNAMASDIILFYKVKESTQRKDGVMTKGYKVIGLW